MQEKEMKEYDSKAAEAANLKKENGDIKEKLRKKEAEIKQVETECEAKMRDTNTAYNAKEDEANDLKREKGDLMPEIGRKEEEIKELKGRVKRARRDRQRGEREAGAEREGFRAQIAGLEERSASLQADHEKRVKNLKKREKRKEKEAAEERGELESELKRRDKRIEDLKRQLQEQEEKVKCVLSSLGDSRLKEMEPPRDPEAPGPGQPSAAGRSSGSSWQRRHSACSCQGRGESSGRRGRQASASNWQKGQGQEGTGGRRATASSRHG
nr:vicilin-like seed storage protein At2g18540 isoform X12 [Penaeus vannamei]